jgi:hypothetical protein
VGVFFPFWESPAHHRRCPTQPSSEGRYKA